MFPFELVFPKWAHFKLVESENPLSKIFPEKKEI